MQQSLGDSEGEVSDGREDSMNPRHKQRVPSWGEQSHSEEWKDSTS